MAAAGAHHKSGHVDDAREDEEGNGVEEQLRHLLKQIENEKATGV